MEYECDSPLLSVNRPSANAGNWLAAVPVNTWQKSAATSSSLSFDATSRIDENQSTDYTDSYLCNLWKEGSTREQTLPILDRHRHRRRHRLRPAQSRSPSGRRLDGDGVE